MKAFAKDDRQRRLGSLCDSVRSLVIDGEYDRCSRVICEAMEHYPHDPEPHNLMGILLEHMGDHSRAMKHFRAAWALDPTYRPASQNLNNYGTFYSNGTCAYDESGCEDEAAFCTMHYNDYGVGHIIRRK